MTLFDEWAYKKNLSYREVFFTFQLLLKQHRHQVNHAAGVTPLIVVPRKYFNHGAHNHGAIGIENGAKAGLTITYFPNGLYKSIVTYGNGIENGPVITYYESGKKRLEGNYLNGFKDGAWALFSPEGKALRQIVYKKGKANNEDDLLKAETSELEMQLRNAGRIGELSLEEFLRPIGYNNEGI